jgi:hypothetical protein
MLQAQKRLLPPQAENPLLIPKSQFCEVEFLYTLRGNCCYFCSLSEPQSNENCGTKNKSKRLGRECTAVKAPSELINLISVKTIPSP